MTGAPVLDEGGRLGSARLAGTGAGLRGVARLTGVTAPMAVLPLADRRGAGAPAPTLFTCPPFGQRACSREAWSHGGKRPLQFEQRAVLMAGWPPPRGCWPWGRG